MYILIDLFFFFTNRIGAPHHEWLTLMKPLSNSSCNCFFNSYSLVKVILYGVFYINVMSKANSMLNFTSLFGVNFGRLLRNTFENFWTIRVSLTPKTTSSILFTICTKNVMHPLLNIYLALIILIIILRTQPFPMTNFSSLAKLK